MKLIKRFATFESNSVSYNKLYELAKSEDTYIDFIKKTDSLAYTYDILYRGMVEGDSLENDIFMTDYVGHALEYSEEGNIDGILYNNKDILYFSDKNFDILRKYFTSLSIEDLKEIYDTDKNVAIDFDFVYSFLHSSEPYSSIGKDFNKNDELIGIMQYFANKKGRNIISFDSGDIIGDREFVVRDINRYTTLKSIYEEVNI